MAEYSFWAYLYLSPKLQGRSLSKDVLMSHSKDRRPRSACGEKRGSPSSTHLGGGGKSAGTVKGRRGLLHWTLGQKPQ